MRVYGKRSFGERVWYYIESYWVIWALLVVGLLVGMMLNMWRVQAQEVREDTAVLRTTMMEIEKSIPGFRTEVKRGFGVTSRNSDSLEQGKDPVVIRGCPVFWDSRTGRGGFMDPGMRIRKPVGNRSLTVFILTDRFDSVAGQWTRGGTPMGYASSEFAHVLVVYWPSKKAVAVVSLADYPAGSQSANVDSLFNKWVNKMPRERASRNTLGIPPGLDLREIKEDADTKEKPSRW